MGVDTYPCLIVSNRGPWRNDNPWIPCSPQRTWCNFDKDKTRSSFRTPLIIPWGNHHKVLMNCSETKQGIDLSMKHIANYIVLYWKHIKRRVKYSTEVISSCYSWWNFCSCNNVAMWGQIDFEAFHFTGLSSVCWNLIQAIEPMHRNKPNITYNIIQASNKENINALLYQPFVRESADH